MTTSGSLIAAIVDGLRASPHSRDAIHSVVCWQIKVLRKVIANEPSFGRQAENIEHAKAVRSLARKLRQELTSMPEGTQRALLAFGAYANRPQMPDPLEIVASNTVERYESLLLTALKDLENGCVAILKSKVGDYHTLKRTKHFCSATGFELMVGLEAGEPTNGDPFRSITNFLFEIVAPKEVREWRRNHGGNGDPDLRTQCEKVLTNWHSDPARLKSHTEWLRRGFTGMIAQKSVSSM